MVAQIRFGQVIRPSSGNETVAVYSISGGPLTWKPRRVLVAPISYLKHMRSVLAEITQQSIPPLWHEDVFGLFSLAVFEKLQSVNFEPGPLRSVILTDAGDLALMVALDVAPELAMTAGLAPKADLL